MLLGLQSQGKELAPGSQQQHFVSDGTRQVLSRATQQTEAKHRAEAKYQAEGH
jgi:hypothetical protein